MKRPARSILIAFALVGVLAAPASAQEPGYPPDEPFPVVLRVGETFDVCKSGQIQCPARVPMCDDPNVALPVDTPQGLGFKGIAVGTTLCSASSANAQRRVFRITVR